MFCWYWIKIINSTLGPYLLYAHSKEDARQKVMIPGQKVRVTPASWRSIEKVTGCKIPSMVQHDSIADSAIPFQTKTMSIRFWCG